MKNTMINKTHVEGLLYEHKLESKLTGENSKHPGTEFISGTISVATDDALTNIVDVHFTYVTAVTSSGKPNATYGILKNIVDGKLGSVMANGKDNAAKLRIDSAIGVNDFYVDRDGTETLVSAKRNEGGFVHTADVLADDEKVRNTFECDMIITKVTHIDADVERNLPEKVVVHGTTFDFRKALVPVEFSAVNPNAMSYFEGLDASPKSPVFTKVWGRQISETVIKTIEEESAFGDSNVREVRNSRKDWVLTGAARDPYVWDDESTITAAELSTLIQNRETYLAEVKQRRADYLATQGKGAASAPAAGGFKF